MTYRNVKAVFDDLATVKLDPDYLKRLQAYITHFLNRNSDHVAFFGGNLTGVYVVRFTDADRREFFDSFVGVEESVLTPHLHALDGINPDFQVSSDPFNLACMYLAYALGRTTKLNPKLKDQAQHSILLLMNIRLLTSLLFRFFRYPADPDIAKATYEALSFKFSLRRLGSWLKVLEERADNIRAKDSLHYKVIANFDKDRDIVYAINDIQGRLRDMLKNITGIHMQLHASGSRIQTVSSVVEIDGVEQLRDQTKSLQKYTRYITGIIADRNSFIKEELVGVIERNSKALPSRPFRSTLEWFSEHYGKRETELINRCINNLLVHAFDYLNANRTLFRNAVDLPNLLTKLKGTYMASRNSDALLQSVKDDMESIVFKATGSKNDAVIAAVRTGTMLYVVARALSLKHYANN